MSSKKRGAPEERISDKAKQAKSNQEPEEEEEEIVDTPPAPSPEEDEAAHLLRILRAGGDKGSLLRRIKEFTNGLQDAKEEDAMIITMRFLNRDAKMPDLFCDLIVRDGTESIKTAITTHMRELKDTRHHHIIIQSSGYGKTRLCLELLKEHKGVYFLCSAIHGVCGQLRWSPCQFITDFLSQMEDDPKDSDVIYTFVSKIYHVLAESTESPQELFEAQFDPTSGAMKTAFYSKFEAESGSPSSDQKSHLRSSDSLSSTRSPDSSKTPPSGSHSSSHNSSGPYLIVFDEFHALPEDTFSLLKYFLDKLNVLGLFLSTSSHVNQMPPDNIANRALILPEPTPLFFLPTTDIYQEHLFGYGRPLWHHHLRHRCDNNFRDLIQYCVQRLTNWSLDSDQLKPYSALALFMCRFGGMSPSSLTVAGDFVTRHIATISSLNLERTIGVNGKRKTEITYEISYPSEPVLAEASCWRTSSIFHRSSTSSHAAVLENLHMEFKEPQILTVNRGDLGEIIGSSLLGYTMDFIRMKTLTYESYCSGASSSLGNTFSSDVSLATFLESLHPKVFETDSAQLFRSEIEGFSVNFTHFIKIPTRADEAFCQLAIERHAGIMTRNFCPSIDLFVTAFKPVGSAADNEEEGSQGPSKRELLHIRVSVKNYNSDLKGKVHGFLDSIRPSHTEPITSDPPTHAISLLINVGSGDMDTIVQFQSQIQTRSSSGSQGVKHLQMALPLTNTECFAVITSQVRDYFLKIAQCRPKVLSQPAMKYGYQVSNALGLVDELVV